MPEAPGPGVADRQERPAVAPAAVVGVEHARPGEEIGAAVVLRPGAQATPDEPREFVEDRVAAYR
ncbi:hypothetical protein GCM10027073_34820 [Streptomyces chlorus]|uniref:AMP-binding enzyme C-terminal domain-containing protein n=1 Tax=Streptomyces chlorus TaxID=887452 RepID=A0ABW1E0U3_9ACTN